MKRTYNFLKIILPLIFLLVSVIGYAQQKTVSGIITSGADGSPLPGVNVIIKGTNDGVSSDFEGNFSIEVEETSVLQFSFLGFLSQEITVQGVTTIDVVLVEDATALDEVVVTGYTTQSKTTVTTAIAKVDAEELQNIPAGGSAVLALSGRVSGVTVLQTTGRAGDTPTIQIRGGTTPGLGGDTPLFIIDGFVQDDLGDTDMNDIEEFTILKDAAAAAIYGARAGNGVIIIKTRRGKAGKFSVSLKYQHEYQSAERHKMEKLTPEEEMYFARLGYVNYENTLATNSFVTRNNWWSSPQAMDSNNSSLLRWTDDVMAANGGQVPAGWVTTADPLTGRLMSWTPTNWQDLTLTDGFSDSYVANINGGTEKATYNFTASLYDNTGIGVYNKYKRYYIKGNTDFTLSDKVKAGSSFRWSMTDTQTGEGNTWYQRSGRQPSTTRYYNEDGTPYWNNTGKRNPDYTEQHLIRGRYNTDMTLNAYLDWEIIKDLHFRPTVNLRQQTYSYLSFELENVLGGSRRNQAGRNDNTINTQYDALLTYNKTLKDNHNLGLLAGATFTNGYDYIVSGTAFNGPSDLTPIILGSTPPENNDIQSSYVKRATSGFYGQLTYDYKRKYLFNSTIRHDGDSRLVGDNRYGTFIGVSGGWNMHFEDWWANLGLSNVLTKSKFSVSYGESGKSSLTIGGVFIDPQGLYATTSYGGETGVRQSILSNEDLVWETTKETDFRYQFTLFQKKPLDISIEYYDKKAVDRLFNEPLPAYTGFTGIVQNIGDFGTTGLEIDFAMTPVKNEKFQWSFRGFAEFALSRKTLKLPDNGTENNRINGTFVYNPNDPTGDPILVGGFAEGEESNDVYVYAHDGVIGTWEEADAYNALISFDEGANLRNRRGSMKVPGNVKWKDLNGDGIINSLDRYKLGNNNWKQHLSLENSFTYNSSIGNFRLSVLLEAFVGHLTYDFNNARVYSQAQGQDFLGAGVRDSYQQPGDEVSGIAQYNWADLHVMNNFNRRDDFWTQKGDFISLRNITLNYAIPKKWAENIGLKDLNAFILGKDLGFLTEYKGNNPQTFGTDGLGGTPPAPLTVSMGVEIKF